MRDRGLILAGLAVFLGVITFPAWYDLAKGQGAAPPQLKLPEGEKECVAPVAYMKTSHMKLLKDWRDQAVRRNIRSHTYNGRVFSINLTGTCLEQCHTDKAAFCDRCHAYSGVQGPYCWDCHVDPLLLRPAPKGGDAVPTGGPDDRR